MSNWKVALTALGLATGAMVAHALEYPIGKPQTRAGLEVAAVYLQPVEMEPEGMMRKASESDIHLEADIRAVADNPNGFPEGSWVPHLLVRYEIAKVGSGEVIKGDMMPMVASDGPHYGDNVKLRGPGKYRLKYTIYPPSAKENHAGHMFGRHVDKATGVRPWFQPFTLEWEFTYAGVGKKGGY
ncbi:iron transporter [Tepidimonas taiwanensis]|uniref:iron transporter n=1 Tax=Tepidimonas taiwanensis TaxID=307486 RepID=UPI0005BADBE5|nr:iron transporter [Tepidimonas taiwanensis]